MDISSTIGGSTYSARTAVIDTLHDLENYTCNDYKCLTLNCIASCCNLIAIGIIFLPKNKITGSVFAIYTAISKFLRSLKDKCKTTKSGLFGCKD